MSDPYRVVRDFEAALCEYTGARYAVTATSCTAALLLAVAWHIKDNLYTGFDGGWSAHGCDPIRPAIEIPNRTYVGVPCSLVHAGARPIFRDEDWMGTYQLKPLPVWDSARRFTSGMYTPGTMQCVSFHWSKILGIQQGGAILHDDPLADAWLRRARFDGRRESVAPKDDTFDMIGHHCYMSPETAAAGLVRLSLLPRDNADLPNSDYPDLGAMEIFK